MENRIASMIVALWTAVISVPLPCSAASDCTWWEAEQFTKGNFPAKTWFNPQNAREQDALSEGNWVTADQEYKETLFLEYDVEVPRSGIYRFFVRKFYKHGPFRWRFDSGAWRECGREIALLDTVELRKHVCANWVSLGEVELAGGTRRLRVELTANKGAAAFDCFLLTTGPFTPSGKLKPGAKLARAPEGWFAFEPEPDPFTESPIDLRYLNEKVAGESGFIVVDGDRFVHGKTRKPVRFWAVNAGAGIVRMDKGSIDYLARQLAKYGVNMVRYHSKVFAGKDIRQVDPELVGKLHYFVAAMKREGIYVALSIYFPLWLDMNKGHGFDGYNNQKPFALLFFNPEFQEIYRDWWRGVLEPRNPHTGLALKDDPAVGFLEILNEDSYFFWTFKPYEAVPAAQMEILERAFGEWLEKKYGSIEGALQAWGGSKVRGDNAAAGRAGFMDLWTIVNRKGTRAEDTVQFLTLHQKRFFEEQYGFLKGDLGFRGSVCGSNWKTANDQILGPLDKYSNTVCDFMDRHGYFGPLHEGEGASYSLRKGHRYDDRCALLFDPRKGEKHEFANPIMDIVYNGKPSIISEVNWPMPNRYRADMPLMGAAYGSLQGTDGLCWFSLSGPTWQQTYSKFPLQTPVTFGQFPGTALAYRTGMIKEGQAVLRAQLNLEDLYALKGAPMSAPQNLEQFRAKDVPPGKVLTSESLTSMDPLAFFVGKVEMSIGAGGRSSALELTRHINREAKTIRSITGELLWDYGRGLLAVNTPKAQGVSGFLSRHDSFALGTLKLQSPMEYGTVLLLALDDEPLNRSSRMLLQVMSEDKNYGWQAPGKGARTIRSLGAPPLVVKQFAGTVMLRRADASRLKVTALDFHGYPQQEVGNADRFELQPATLYYLID